MNRWSKSGVMDRILEKLQLEQMVRVRIEALSLDSTSVKVHPDGTGALKKRTTGQRKSCDRWTTKIHMVVADARTAIAFALSPGNAHDAPEGRELLRDLGSFPGMPVIMDRAYEDLFRRLKGYRRSSPASRNRIAYSSRSSVSLSSSKHADSVNTP
jgi:Transposase DDE domain